MYYKINVDTTCKDKNPLYSYELQNLWKYYLYECILATSERTAKLAVICLIRMDIDRWVHYVKLPTRIQKLYISMNYKINDLYYLCGYRSVISK